MPDDRTKGLAPRRPVEAEEGGKNARDRIGRSPGARADEIAARAAAPRSPMMRKERIIALAAPPIRSKTGLRSDQCRAARNAGCRTGVGVAVGAAIARLSAL